MDMIVSNNTDVGTNVIAPCGNNSACLRFDQCFCKGEYVVCSGTYNA